MWWVPLDEAEGLPPPEATLGADELEHAARLRSPLDAKRFLRGRVATRVLLARLVDADPASLAFDRTCEHCGGPHGKPRLAPRSDVRFNASRAGGVFALAAAVGREVGIDLEARERARDAKLVVDAFFAPAERARFEALGGAAQADAFLEMWTRKEAFLKLRGLGLAAPLDRVDTSAWRDAEALRDPLTPDGGRFSLHGFGVGPDMFGSLAVADPPVEVRIRRVAA